MLCFPCKLCGILICQSIQNEKVGSAPMNNVVTIKQSLAFLLVRERKVKIHGYNDGLHIPRKPRCPNAGAFVTQRLGAQKQNERKANSKWFELNWYVCKLLRLFIHVSLLYELCQINPGCEPSHIPFNTTCSSYGPVTPDEGRFMRFSIRSIFSSQKQ